MIGRRDRNLIPLRGLTLVPGKHEADPEPDPTGGGLDRDAVSDLKAQRAYLLGVLVDQHVQQTIDNYGATPTPLELDRLHDEARRLFMDRACAFEGISDDIDRFRRLGSWPASDAS